MPRIRLCYAICLINLQWRFWRNWVDSCGPWQIPDAIFAIYGLCIGLSQLRQQLCDVAAVVEIRFYGCSVKCPSTPDLVRSCRILFGHACLTVTQWETTKLIVTRHGLTPWWDSSSQIWGYLINGRRGTPSPLTPPETPTFTRLLSNHGGVWHRIWKLFLKVVQPFIQKFATSKIPLYMV